MADIQTTVLIKYGIDIAQENIFKLYKIDTADISPQDIEDKIQETRKRWNTSINGANEKNAERDKIRLEKADKYETILKDSKLRKQVFDFYNKQGEKKGGDAAPGGGTTEFAREYFELVATTKKIKKEDVDFFFKYYQSERKNKKAILEMLKKEMKINFLGKEDKYGDEVDTEDEDEKRKKNTGPLIVNLFQEATILKIRRAFDKFDEAAQNAEICKKYPKIRDGLYEFLEIGDVKDAEQFAELMSAKGKEIYAIRQERGTEYVPLVDLFNILQSIADYQDVVDNIPEFKLLLKYPNLTPYMFAFVDMKPSTVKGIIDIAKRDYTFRDDTDFLLSYYKPIHDNFGISDSGIGSILRKAEKKAKQNKVLNSIDEKLGRSKNKRKVSIGAEIVHWLVYWPIFAVFLVFEIAKFIFTKVHYFAIPAFVLLLGLESWLVPKRGIENLLILRKLFFKSQWLSYLNDFWGVVGRNWVENLLLSLVLIIILLLIYILPPLFIYLFIAEFSDDFNKRFDWVGIERTLHQMLDGQKRKSEEQYISHKKLFFKNKIPKVIINLLCLIMTVVLIVIASKELKKYNEANKNAFQELETESNNDIGESDENYIGDINLPEEIVMVIKENSSNIRSGPGTNYDVIATAHKGDTFYATGNQETASNGRTWYEIYIDNEKTKTGWASQKVIEFQ